MYLPLIRGIIRSRRTWKGNILGAVTGGGGYYFTQGEGGGGRGRGRTEAESFLGGGRGGVG